MSAAELNGFANPNRRLARFHNEVGEVGARDRRWHADQFHGSYVEAMSVTRATVSGPMAGLEREGLVESAIESDDRRKLVARLAAKGEIIVEEGFGVAMARFGKLFASFSREELTTLTALLNRVREEFVPPS